MNDAAEEVHAKLAVRTDRLSRAFLALAAVALAGSLLLFAFGFAAARYRVHRWDPLGDYPTQKVINREHLVGIAGTVDVVAQKCARVRAVNVRTTQLWVPVNEPERAVPIVLGGSAVRYRSCGPTPTESTFGFHNPIPTMVAAEVRAGLHIWRITGTDTPYDATGREGIPRTWTTETFTIQ